MSRTHHRRTRLALSALTAPLTMALVMPTAPAVATQEPPSPPAPVEESVTRHSSDEQEPTVSLRSTGTPGYFTLDERTAPVAPGLDHTSFDRYDARGWVRVNVLTATLSTPGLRLDYASPGKVSTTAPLTTALRRDRAVAGVNADFFDIGDTGAPLGVGVDRQRGLLHGSRRGVNHTFLVDRQNAAAIAQSYLQASVKPRNMSAFTVTNLNSPEVAPDGIGIYTPAWGSAARIGTVSTAAPRREVTVVGGVVRRNSKTLSSGPIPKGTVLLVGRGKGAGRLLPLKRGKRVTVSYGLDRSTTRVAVGGNVRLLRDGSFVNLNDSELHPRTAIGIDRDENKIIILTADGRQSHSRGLTMRETAVMMRRLGAEDALNLDGGGSATMVARQSGEPGGVVNSPSDGRLRAVPNGLGFAVTNGSGKLRGIRVEPVADMLDSHRVLTGLTRTLVARGHDEAYDPVAAKPSWSGAAGVSARSGPAVRTVVRGRQAGTGTVTATAGSATGRFPIRVLGRVHRLETTVPGIALSRRGSRSGFELRGYDGRGFGTWVEPRDVRLSYDRDKLTVRRVGRGFVVGARVASTSDVIRLTAGGVSTYLGVTVGLARSTVDRMDSLSGWSPSAYPARARARLGSVADRHGRAGRAIALRYSLEGARRVRAAYANADPARRLPGRARRVGLWVRGDAKGAFLRMTVRDAAGARATVDLSGRVGWRGWRWVTAGLPGGLVQPLRVERLYAVETDRKRVYSGTLAFDQITAMSERVTPVPPGTPPQDPMVAEHGPMGTAPLEVAAVSGARVSSAAPRSGAVTRFRTALRQVLAAGPDLLLLNGDMVARPTSANFALVKRILDEELRGRIGWRYVPGDAEAGAGGDLSAFRSAFGSPVAVFDQEGTRFVLLNTAPGTFRSGGFAQLTTLRSRLASAAADGSVGSVVVVAHHPTDDPVAGGTAQVADSREGALVQELLTRFRADSGKHVGYVASHGRRFGLARYDDMVQVSAGPLSDPVTTGAGAFVGWTAFRIAPAADLWLRTEMRPLVARLRVETPATVATGSTHQAGASLVQLRRRTPVEYPMNAVWQPSTTTHVGPPGQAGPNAVLAYEPATGRLTALRPGTTDLVVTVNGVTARKSVTVS
jgi:hypothetical protein